MNKILLTARKAKGATEEDLASVLGITPLRYRALESRQEPVTPDFARMLAGYFSVPAWYFLETARPLDIKTRIDLLRRQYDIVAKPEYRVIPPGASVALATTVIELMIAKEELGQSLSRELELTEDLAAVTAMYEHLLDAVNADPGAAPRG